MSTRCLKLSWLLAGIMIGGCQHYENDKMIKTQDKSSEHVSWPLRLGELVQVDVERRLWDGSFDINSYNQMLGANKSLVSGVGSPKNCRLRIGKSLEKTESTLDDAQRMVDLTITVDLLDPAESYFGKKTVVGGISPFRLDRTKHWRPVYVVDFATGSKRLVDDSDNIALWVGEQLLLAPLTDTYSQIPQEFLSKMQGSPEIKHLTIPWDKIEVKAVGERMYLKMVDDLAEYEFVSLTELGSKHLLPIYRKRLGSAPVR